MRYLDWFSSIMFLTLYSLPCEPKEASGWSAVEDVMRFLTGNLYVTKSELFVRLRRGIMAALVRRSDTGWIQKPYFLAVLWEISYGEDNTKQAQIVHSPFLQPSQVKLLWCEDISLTQAKLTVLGELYTLSPTVYIKRSYW